jgi:xylan 1,4-beta-xylosidase
MSKPVQITVDASCKKGSLDHTWNYIGYDECNYTHSPGGIALIEKFGKLEKPYYIRAHHMLCTGNCLGFYKWGSTNVYTEDEQGNPVYSFEVIDKMCDIWLNHNCKPFFEIGFMPMDMADLSDLKGPRGGVPYNEYKRIGWNRPPKDYDKWYGLIRAIVEHLLERYGQKELESWYFEMWNEPDAPYYWSGTNEEFCKMYDYTEAAIHDVSTSLRFGGPATCGTMESEGRAATFLRKFLDHAKSGKNYRSGKTGTRLDFTTFHTKGGGYRFTTSKALEKTPSVKKLLDEVRVSANIIKKCGYGDLECVLSEADPDGLAAGGRFDNPAFQFRNTEYYASYVASSYKNIYDVAATLKMDIRPLAWAFMFDNERCFEGTRTFSTQGIDKAVMNVFRMYAALGNTLVDLKSSRDLDPLAFKDLWGEGEGAEIDGWATVRDTGNLAVLVYCHEDAWKTEDLYPVEFTAENLPFRGPCKITHYRIDKELSNAHAEWVRQGQPDYPVGQQYDAIKARDGLELAGPVKTADHLNGKIALHFDMPVKSVSLILIEEV